jgi:transposase
MFEKFWGHDHEIHILIENSTKSHDVYWMLTNLGYHVVVAHAPDLYRITKSTKKNDDNDARELAGYMRRRLNGEDEFRESFIPDAEWMKKRALCRFLADQKNYLARTKQQVRSYLLLNGMYFMDDFKDVSTKKALKRFVDTKEVIPKLLAESMDHNKKLIIFTEKVISQEFNNNRMFDILLSIPGVGLHTAAYLTAEIVDIDRFESRKGFSSYFGVRPSQHDSADSLKSGHISHRGDDLARKLCFQATFVHIFHCPESPIAEKYNRLISKGKPHRLAVVACENSMFMMMFSMIKGDTCYQSDPETVAKARYMADSLDLHEDDEDDDQLTAELMETRYKEDT